MTDAQPGPEKMTAAMVVDMFEPQIDEVTAAIGQSKQAEDDAQAALDKADGSVEVAKAKRAERFDELRDAQMGTRIMESRLEERQKVALAALGATESSSSETFAAQTRIETGDEEAAAEVIEKIRGVNEQLSEEDAANRLIVIGALPVVSQVDPPNPYHNQNVVSFVEVGDDTRLGIWRAAGRHYVNLMPGLVNHVGLPDSEDKIPFGHRDETGYNRLIAVEPLELRFVSTAHEVQQLVQGQARPYPSRYGSITVGSSETDAMEPAIITGEAVDEFTSWLAKNDALRVLVFAAAFDRAGDTPADAVPKLPEGSRAQELAREAFKDRIQLYVGDIAANNIQEHVEVERMRDDLLFSREVQEYIGISDNDLVAYVTEALQPHVAVEQDEHNKDAVNFVVRNTGMRSFTTAESMCEFVDKKFGEAGYGEYGMGLIMNVIARDLELGALRETLDYYSEDTRSERRFRRRLNEVMERIETDKKIWPHGR